MPSTLSFANKLKCYWPSASGALAENSTDLISIKYVYSLTEGAIMLTHFIRFCQKAIMLQLFVDFPVIVCRESQSSIFSQVQFGFGPESDRAASKTI